MQKLVQMAVVLGLIICCAMNGQAAGFPSTGSTPVTVSNTTSNPVPVSGTVNCNLDTNMTVVNPTSNPVPVSGSVTVINTTANPIPVAATVNGTVNTSTSVTNSSANPIPITGTVSASTHVFRFIGYSTATAATGSGPRGMHEPCQSAFGAEARMCTTYEFMSSPAPATGSAPSFAWINPHRVDGDHDYSGLEPLNCGQWAVTRDPTEQCLAVQPSDLRIIYYPCIQQLSVTCCAP